MPIGVFDSGYGGLTILKSIKNRLPDYDYIYIGDNARSPYGNRSFEVVYDYTLQAVNELFRKGCHLVILACNTASAKALRSIQQKDLPRIDPSRRVLGVIRPTIEILPRITRNGHIGLLATPGTVASKSYTIETNKLFPDLRLSEHACPMWVPLVENDEYASTGADYFIQKDLQLMLSADPEIDTIILGCTHYPLLLEKIKKFLSSEIKILCQGDIVAESLKDYLVRHPEIEKNCSKGGTVYYFTSENPEKFDSLATKFMNEQIHSRHIDIAFN